MTAALEASDPVAARTETDELLAAVESAVADGEVPNALARELRRGAERLAALVDAAQPPPPAPEPPPEDDDEDDDGGGKGKGKDKDKNGDDEDDDE